MPQWGRSIDLVCLLILVNTLLISVGAQILVSSAYRQRSTVKNGDDLIGELVIERNIQQTGVLDEAGMMQAASDWRGSS